MQSNVYKVRWGIEEIIVTKPSGQVVFMGLRDFLRWAFEAARKGYVVEIENAS
jgi:hypothetical protein